MTGSKGSAGESGRDRSDEQRGAECDTGTETIARWTGNKADKECGCQGNDVGVGDVVCGEVQVLCDGNFQLVDL